MSKMMKRWKRTLAAFMAVCVVLTSFNGTALADDGRLVPVDAYESRDVLFKLDAKQLREYATDAIQNSIMSGEAFDFESLGISSVDDAGSAYAALFSGADGQVYEMRIPYAYDEGDEDGNLWMDEIPDGASLRLFVRTGKAATPSNADMADGEEENRNIGLDGTEEYIFFLINNSEYNLNFRVELDGRQTAAVRVLCRDAMSVTKATDSNAAIPGGGIVNQPASTAAETLPAVSETAAAEESTALKPVQDAESSGADEFGSEAEAGTDESSEAESSEAEGTEAESTEADSTEAESTEAESTEAASEEQTEQKIGEDEAAPVYKEESDSNETEEALTVSRSRHEAPVVGTPQAGYVDDSRFTSPEDEYGDEAEAQAFVIEEFEESEASVSKKIAGVVLGTVVLESPVTLLSLFDISSGSEDGTAGGLVTAGKELYGADADALFSVTLYDYSGTGKSNAAINRYAGDFKFGGGDNAAIQNGFKFNAYGDWPWKEEFRYNIVQGITKPVYENGKLVNRFTDKDLFPAEQTGVDPDTIRMYPEVNIDGLFEVQDGYYAFDSANKAVKYHRDGNTHSLVEVTDWWELRDYKNGIVEDGSSMTGFWPFKNDNNYFGMKMSFDFSVMEDGQYNGQDMVFEFQGDDDVWVYFTRKGDTGNTGRIALDIGGNHNRMKGSINFASGVIQYSKVNQGLIDSPIRRSNVVSHQYNGSSWEKFYNTTDSQAYLYTKEDAEANGYKDADFALGYMGFGREELAEYKLDFYYLERGGNASNCSLKFNIPVFSQDEISISKRVYSEDNTDKNETYQFDLYVKTPSSSDFTLYDKITVKGSGEGSTQKVNGKFLAGTQYYFVETEYRGANATTWSSNGSVTTGTEERISPIYTVGQTNNVVCSNYFDMSMGDAVEKEANQDESKQDHYAIGLTVNGSTLTADEEATEEVELTNLVVTDPLSKYVDFVLDDKGAPQLSLRNGLGNEVALVASGTENEFTYRMPDDDTVIAEVNLENKLVTWYVTSDKETLGAGESKKLVYQVRTTAHAIYYADGSYPHTGGKLTGTFAEKAGYYSNGNEEQDGAVLVYETTIDTTKLEKEFPHPVVRPTEHGVLTVTKRVEAEITLEEGTVFDFKADFSGLTGSYITRQINDQTIQQLAVSDNSVSDSIQLGHDDVVTYSGLNEGVQYVVEETINIENPYYNVELVETSVNGKKTESVTNPLEGTINQENKKEQLGFVNTYTMKTTALTLTKKLVEVKEESITAAKADTEDVSFMFRITNQDPLSLGYGDVFFRRITIPAGQTELTLVITGLPVSTEYQVHEMDQMRYELVGENDKIANAENMTVVFENHKVSDGLFSSTSVVTNKVNGDFEFTQQKEMPTDEIPIAADTVVLALPSTVKTSDFDSDGYEDGDTQLV